MIDITNVIRAAFLLLEFVVVCVLIPLIRRKYSAQQQKDINAWVRIAVTAAEQIYAGPGRGAEKKAFVLAFLHDHNITLDEGKIDAMIEAAVYYLKTGFLPVIGEAVTGSE